MLKLAVMFKTFVLNSKYVILSLFMKVFFRSLRDLYNLLLCLCLTKKGCRDEFQWFTKTGMQTPLVSSEQLKVMILDKLNVTAHSEIKIRIYVTIYLFRSFLI